MGSGEAKRFRELYGSAGRHGASFWEEEKDNVGMRLLKNMGWAMGQGLGKDGRGRTDHVKQFRKKDNAGIGSKAGTRDEAFKASQELFNDVLSRLSGTNAAEPAAEAPTLGSAATSVRGVMARRQMSRRFCRAQPGQAGIAAVGGMAAGHMAGATSMDEIFGRRSSNGGDAIVEEQDETSERPPELQQITSSVSLHDYFARRRAQLGMAGVPSSGAAAPAAPAGFTLDDQAAFAEAQMAKAYGGRRGLGMASAAGGGCAQMTVGPPQKYGLGPPATATHVAPTQTQHGSGSPAKPEGVSKVKKPSKPSKSEKQAAKADRRAAGECSQKMLTKAERKAQKQADKMQTTAVAVDDTTAVVCKAAKKAKKEKKRAAEQAVMEEPPAKKSKDQKKKDQKKKAKAATKAAALAIAKATAAGEPAAELAVEPVKANEEQKAALKADRKAQKRIAAQAIATASAVAINDSSKKTVLAASALTPTGATAKKRKREDANV